MTGQQLKNSILQEAIEGRLVSQDPNDEPASVLLERIRAEKARLVKEKKIKKSRTTSNTELQNTEQVNFDIPGNWCWTTLGEICIFLSRGKSPKYSETDKTYPVFAQKCNLKDGGISLEQARFLDPSSISKWDDIYKLRTGDVLINSTGTGTVCRTRLFDEKYLGIYPFVVPDSHVSVVRTSEYIYSEFVLAYISSKTIQQFLEDNLAGSTNQKELYIGVLEKLPIPLPPYAEQHRIVEKIESLLPKVEAYGKAQEELEKLNEALPEQLKRSILQEAIEGRLVPQDPNDEPASVLLERICAEKARLVKEKKIKKDKNESRIYRTDDGHWMEHFEDKNREDVCIDEEIPFDVPSGWEWCRLKENVSIISGLSYKKENLEVSSDKYIRVLRGGNISYGNWCSKADDVMIAEKFVPQELILKSGTFISPAVTSLEHMGKTALVREDQDDIVVGGFVLMLIPFYKNNSYLEYLNSIFQTAYYKEKCQSITNKSGQAFYNLSRAKLLEVLIPLPPLAEQHRIVEKLEEILPKLNNLKKETEK